jgi:acetolactate synthase-1/3 small subunit
VNVIKIQDLGQADMVDRELVLYKVNAPAERRHEIIEIANVFRTKIVDVGKNTLTIEATGASDKLCAMEDLLRAYGIKEVARTGKIALSRGMREVT